ncbi:YciI family protein [Roseiterribacter gracilis]|uniref:Dehydrogenase n=1 Tax=Roseiterribacter gracilis TaxID=2812848 RepID=A0A8S8XCM7_9PROT|nr:dehydrogenase [Rhodospirillales bacterium TMPK1]
MRFMMIVKANADSEAGAKASPALVEAMGRFNEQMVKAGILLDGVGLRPSRDGARVLFDGRAKPQVIDGPFAETKELVAGFWLIDVKSKEEAIEWAKRCPSPHGLDKQGVIELRRVYEAHDFAEILPDGVTQEQLARLNAGTKV